MEFFDGMQSENLPHKSGITTFAGTAFCVGGKVGKLAPQIGDYDGVLYQVNQQIDVGKLAPQIGDYDLYSSSICGVITVGKLAPQIGDYD